MENFKNGKKYQTLLGVTGSGKTFTMANVIKKLGRKTLVLAHNKTLAAQLYGEFKEFFPHNAVTYFVSYYDYYRPEAYIFASDTYVEKESSLNEKIDKLRHQATSSLVEREDTIVVASVSCIYGIGSPDEYASQRITLFAGEEFSRDKLLSKLVEIKYQSSKFDLERGHFRVRGDTVELLPPGEEDALRIEFFDNTIEKISLVDPLRGSTIQVLNKATIHPTSHFVTSKARLERAKKTIKEELRQRLTFLKKEGKLLQHQRLKERTLLDLEMLDEMGYCNGIENYSRHFTGLKEGEPPPTLIDFFDNNFLIIIDESHMSIPQVRAMYRGDRSRKESLVEHGFRLPSALDNRPLKFEEFETKLNQVLFVSATPAKYELIKSEGEFVEQINRPTGLLDPVAEVRNAQYQVDNLLVECKRVIAQGQRVLITTLTKKLAEELTSYYQSLGLKVKYLHSDVETIERMEIIQDLRKGIFDILVGINLLREGLDLPEVALVGILDADKEGFLRSEGALIQTMGRAARNEKGRVILYAYKTTPSMKKALDESFRRRNIQISYNTKHGITPTTIDKKVQGGLLATLGARDDQTKAQLTKKVAQLTPEEVGKRIEQLKIEMKVLARELKFESAAKVRDEIKKLEELRLLF